MNLHSITNQALVDNQNKRIEQLKQSLKQLINEIPEMCLTEAKKGNFFLKLEPFVGIYQSKPFFFFGKKKWYGDTIQITYFILPLIDFLNKNKYHYKIDSELSYYGHSETRIMVYW